MRNREKEKETKKEIQRKGILKKIERWKVTRENEMMIGGKQERTGERETEVERTTTESKNREGGERKISGAENQREGSPGGGLPESAYPGRAAQARGRRRLGRQGTSADTLAHLAARRL